MNLFIGSSSIGVFKLFKNNNKVLKVKGATAKGLNTNDNGKNIIKYILNLQRPINCIILHFGEVDINFSYYYKMCQLNKKYIDFKLFCNEIFNEYSKFIEQISNLKKCKNIILKGLYPNPITDSLKKEQFLNYHVMDNTDCLLESTLNFKFQEKLRKYYNYLLKKYCIEKNKHNIKNNESIKYFYYDLDKYILKDGNIVKKFIDISPVNIHLRWEPMIPYHIKILKDICNLSKTDLIDINKEEKIYMKYKINKLKEKRFYKRKSKIILKIINGNIPKKHTKNINK